MHQPDWTKKCGVHGGTVDKAGSNPVRMFPNDQDVKRHVRVNISNWPMEGGNHFYTDIKEEDNPLWCGTDDDFHKGGYWFVSWIDQEGYGRLFGGRWSARVYALRYITQVVRENFPEAEFNVTDSMHEPWTEWDDGPLPQPGELVNRGHH